MPLEIEHKFLIKNDGWKALADAGTLYKQGYLSVAGEATVRVRIAGEKAYLTIKSRRVGISRKEFEYEIPVNEAIELLEMSHLPVIEKTRYIVPFAGMTWEVDVFYGDNEGLIIAEVELSDADQAIELPDWAGEQVSTDNRYANSNLARNPFKNW